MNAKIRTTLVAGAALVLVAALLAVIITGQGRALAAPSAATLPPSTACTPGTGTVICELWAMTGTLNLPGGASVPMWGY